MTRRVPCLLFIFFFQWLGTGSIVQVGLAEGIIVPSRAQMAGRGFRTRYLKITVLE